MAKKNPGKNTTKSHERETNWVLIGGIMAGGILILVALLILATQSSDVQSIADYCEENPESCFVLGREDAPVTIVEVADFGCSHCRDFHIETFGALEAEYVTMGQVKIVMLPFALSDATLPASNAAVCAGQQDQYFPFAAALFNQYNDPTTLTRDGFIRQCFTHLIMQCFQFQNQCVGIIGELFCIFGIDYN